MRTIMAITEAEKEIEKRWGVDADILYRSIGHLVFNFSRFEHVVRGRYVAHLEFNHTQRQFVMPAMDFAFLCGSCKFLFEKTYSGKKLKTLTAILNEGLKINTTARIPLAHGSWYQNRPAGLSVYSSRNNLEERNFFGKPGELDKLAERLFVLRHQLWDMTQMKVEKKPK
jgi:hypothetical protein